MNSKDFNKLQNIFSSKSFEEEVEHETYMFALLLLSQIEKEAEKQGINRKELANKIGKSPSYLTQLFRSNKIPNLKVITAMALALGKRFDAQTVECQKHAKKNVLTEFSQSIVECSTSNVFSFVCEGEHIKDTETNCQYSTSDNSSILAKIINNC